MEKLLMFLTVSSATFAVLMILFKIIGNTKSLKNKEVLIANLVVDSTSPFVTNEPKTIKPNRLTALFLQRADRANYTGDISAWTRYLLVSTLVLSLVFTILTANIVVGIVLALLFTGLAFFAITDHLASKHRKKFADELPDALMIVASAMRTGLNLRQAFESLAKQDNSSVGAEMARALQEVSLGSSLQAALRRVASRTENKDFDWLVDAIDIQREVGGALSTIFDSIANTIHSRSEIKREIRTLAAEGKLSANILVLMPIAIFGFLLLTRPGYLSVFLTETVGYVMLLIMVALMVIGWKWIQKIVEPKV